MKKTTKKVLLGLLSTTGLFLASSTAINADNIKHTVSQNETVWGLSQKYNVSIKSIEALNRINDDHLIITGQTLQIPNESQKSYTIKSGDSLWSIANKFNISLNDLLSLNNLNIDDIIHPNQTLKLPTGATFTNESTTATNTVNAPVANTQQNNTQTAVVNNNVANYNQNQVQSQQQPAVAQPATPATQPQQQPAAPAPIAAGGSITGFAQSFVGVPYVWGGTSPAGFDCSGLVQYVYSHFGISLPRTTTAQENAGTVIPASQAQPGDLYFWGAKGSTYHVAIALGGGSYVHAPQPGQNVKVGSVQYYTPSFAVRVR